MSKTNRPTRQAMTVTINELHNLIEELENNITETISVEETLQRKFQLNIINKTPECSDTWEFE